MSIERAEESWRHLAARDDIVGKHFVFDNRVGDCLDEGTIRRIIVDGGYVTIESDELEEACRKGFAWSPTVRFKIDEERDAHLIGNTIFCDLDDLRQIRIQIP